MLLTKSQILKAKDLKTEDVLVPGWGGTVRVRTITGAERDDFEAAMFKGQGKNRVQDLSNLRAKLLALAIINDKGATIFEPGDIEALGMKSAESLDKVFTVAKRLAGLEEDDIKEMTKNSGTILGEDSSID